MIGEEKFKYILKRLIENAEEAHQDFINNPKSSFEEGRRIAYYEMLDIIKNELDVEDVNIKEFGFEIDVDKYV